MPKKTLAFVVYPGISLLELVGNCSLLSIIMGLGPLMKLQTRYDTVVVGERIEEIKTDTPMSIIPQKTFADVPQPDALVVIGGGTDTLPALENANLISYVQRAAESARWVAATSTGALMLAAAGLLEGHQATTHWAYMDRLEAYGAIPQSPQSRGWVTDGNFIPGGDAPTMNAMSNLAIRQYIRTAASSAQWTVSVCTGALLLASVGLLEGCDVTTHWAYTRFLKNLGARYVQQRWTVNGNIINAAGVSAGIDTALYLVSLLTNEETTRTVQWLIHYDPMPPFGGINYKRMKLLPRLSRAVNSLRFPLSTRKSRQGR